MNMYTVVQVLYWTIWFVLFVNILGFIYYPFEEEKQKQTDKCCVEKCKNESFQNTQFCYWHDPVRKYVYPLGSELRPRRSQRIAAQKGGFYTMNMNID